MNNGDKLGISSESSIVSMTLPHPSRQLWGKRYQSPSGTLAKEKGVKITHKKQPANTIRDTKFLNASNIKNSTTNKDHEYVKQLENESKLLSSRLIPAIQSNSSKPSNNSQNVSNATSSHNSICLKNAYRALSHAIIILNLLKKLMALFSTAFMIDCKFTEHGGHLGIQCTQQHTVKHIEDFATDSTFVLRDAEKVSILYLNQLDECYLPSCSAIHPKELEIIKRTQHNEYLKVIGNPCKHKNTICDQPSIHSKCGTMTRYCKDIKDWYTPIWWLETRSYLDPFAEGNAKHSRFTDCKTGNECCAFYVMPGINKSIWESIVDDEFLKTYCYVAGIYHASHHKFKDVFYTDGHFTIGSKLLSWPKAKEFCEETGGRLATPSTKQEFEQAMTFIKIHGQKSSIQLMKYGYDGKSNGGRYWLGITDIKEPGIWRDTNGRIVKDFYGFQSDGSAKNGKESWAIHEPSNQRNNDKYREHCVEAFGYVYNDYGCDNVNYPLCEFVASGEEGQVLTQTKIRSLVSMQSRYENFLQTFPMLNSKNLVDGVEYFRKYLKKPDKNLRSKMVKYLQNPFFMGTEIMTWDDAAIYCDEQGGSLATPYSQKEYEKVESMCAGEICWLGFNNRNELGLWENVKGVISNAYGFDGRGNVVNQFQSKTAWKRGEPNNQFGREHCIQYWSGTKWKNKKGYNDAQCTNKHIPLCQRDKDGDMWMILQRYDSIYDIDDDSIENEIDKQAKIFQDSLANATPDFCIKIFEYEGSISTDT